MNIAHGGLFDGALQLCNDASGSATVRRRGIQCSPPRSVAVAACGGPFGFIRTHATIVAEVHMIFGGSGSMQVMKDLSGNSDCVTDCPRDVKSIFRLRGIADGPVKSGASRTLAHFLWAGTLWAVGGVVASPLLAHVGRELPRLPAAIHVSSGATENVPQPAQDWARMLRSDLDAFHEIALADHPGPVNPLDPGFRGKFETEYARALARVKITKTQADYEWTLRELSASFRDGHFGILIDKPLTQVRAWPGFLTELRDGKPILTDRVEPTAPPVGAELISCDGRTAQALADDRLSRMISKWDMRGERDRDWPYLFVDNGDPFLSRMRRCTFRADGRTSEYVLKWRSLSEAENDKIVEQHFERFAAGVGLRTFGPGKYWISLSSFATDPNSKNGQKLQSLVDAVKREAQDLRKAKAIVFDLRGNNGGSSLWLELISRAIWGEEWVDAHEPRVEAVDYRASTGNIAYFQDLFEKYSAQTPPNEAMIDQLRSIRDGMKTSMASGQPFFREPEANQKPASLPAKLVSAHAFVITEDVCASSCLDAVDLLKNLEATQVGRETSGDTLYIDVHYVPLPSGLASAYVPVKVFRGRQRGSNETYKPEISYTGDLAKTDTLEALVNGWLANH